MKEARRLQTIPQERPLPAGWCCVRLAEVSKFVHGGTPSKAEPAYWRGEIPWVSPKDMRSRTISDTQDHISAEAVKNSSTSVVPEGTILTVVRSGILARAFPIAVTGRAVAFNQDIKAILPDHSKVDVQFLCWCLMSQEPYVLANGIKKGATVHSIRSGFIESLAISFPPLPDQRRIAEVLNEQIAAVERAHAAAQVRLEAAKALPAAYLRAIFTSSEVQHWPRRRLGDVCRLLPSKSIASDGDTEVLAITTAALTETGFQLSGVKVARMWAADALECVVSPGEILVARSNTPELVGRAAMFLGDPLGAVASDLTIRIAAGEHVVPGFVTAFLSFLYLTGYWKERAGGASGSMKKITRTQIEEQPLPVPPVNEQGRVAAILEGQIAAVGRTWKAVEAELAAIDALPGAILRRAFSGEF